MKAIKERVQWSTLIKPTSKIKPKSTEGLISVKIDAKTTVLVKPGTDIEAVKAKYANYRNQI